MNQRFDIGREIHLFARELVVALAQEMTEDDIRNMPMPISSFLPAPGVMMSFEASAGDVLLEKQEDGHISVREVRSRSLLGRYAPGSCVEVNLDLEGRVSEDVFETITSHLFRIPFIVSLINEPRFVRIQPGGTRQQRRAAQRGGGMAVDAWHRVSWDIGKETFAKVSRDPSFHKMPLHYRRGHQRKAEEHFRGAYRRPDALRPEHREGWWQWIEGQWVGHPAFGLKKSVYAPRLSDPSQFGRAA